MKTTAEILKAAKGACPEIAILSEEQKNKALLTIAEYIENASEQILKANEQDINEAKDKISPVMTDRLRLTKERIHAMAEGIREVSTLPDPVGNVLQTVTRPNGLVIKKVSVPMGVCAMIYESRPNVTSDAAALALKSGNVCVLRGGKEAYRTSFAIVDAIKDGLKHIGITENAVQMIEDTTRQGATDLMTATGMVDLLIPRGGAGLIRACVEQAKVPCIQTGTGICHIYVDKDADLSMALDIIENAKTSRPSVCNAAEVCVVHSDVIDTFLPMLKKRLCDDREKSGLIPVELRLDDRAVKVIDGTKAQNDDFDTEFLDYIMAVKTVDSLEEATAHIAKHSTHHSDAIVTENEKAAEYFMSVTDSAAVYVNASTRFTDGGEFGLGCEIGISTQKLHARGPMGLAELTTYQYRAYGNGQKR